MKTSNMKEEVRRILQEFKTYDKLHHKFSLDFENGIYNFIADNPNIITLPSDFSDDLKSFAISLINCAYEVIEKDSGYAKYRINTELENMDHLLTRYPTPTEKTHFTEEFSKMAKAKMPEYFPGLYDLSADGFRLLERSTSYRINAFLMYLYGDIAENEGTVLHHSA